MKALCMNQKAIATCLSMAIPKDPLTLLSLSEDDFEEEAADEAPLVRDDLEDKNEDDDGADDGDKEDEDDEDDENEDGEEGEEEGDGEDEDYD